MLRLRRSHILFLATMTVLLGAGCRQPDSPTVTVVPPTKTPLVDASPTTGEMATPESTSARAEELAPMAPTATPQPLPTSAGSPTPLYDGPLAPVCGQTMPALLLDTAAPTTNLPLDPQARRVLLDRAPPAAQPALAQLLDNPGTVGLAAYQVGREDQGVFLNTDTPMPLASITKLVVLVAYAEATAAGELNPQELVPLSEIERYYLPRFDLGAHRRAVAELRADGRLSEGDDPRVLLEDVAWMMVRHSSNAASDYLHRRLGQERIEQTAQALGLTSHSAPCTFLGQFLLMANHTRAETDRIALQAYRADTSSAYGSDVALLADTYTGSQAFRQEETLWRRDTRRPSIETQRDFTAQLGTRGTAGGYAALMARLAQNGLTSADSSFAARKILEWPNQFEANQELFSNVGYKNGSLPGVLNTAYYAYRWGETAPVVVVLFYRDLPQQTYRSWRRNLPHDELARWLLADPEAMGLLRAVIEN